MSGLKAIIAKGIPLVVGSFGDLESLTKASLKKLTEQCDLAEIRLDLFSDAWRLKGSQLWAHLEGFPLMFTTRSSREGSPINLSVLERMEMLTSVLETAAIIDIEAEELSDFEPVWKRANEFGTPWLASHHNFEKLPDLNQLRRLQERAIAAGCSCFKVASAMTSLEDLITLANFQHKNSSVPLATMGMGTLGPVSRLLNTQCGSLFNYGYLGSLPTAPGQWSAKQLKEGISKLEKLNPPQI